MRWTIAIVGVAILIIVDVVAFNQRYSNAILYKGDQAVRATRSFFGV